MALPRPQTRTERVKERTAMDREMDRRADAEAEDRRTEPVLTPDEQWEERLIAAGRRSSFQRRRRS